jgi:hypothetical protein
MDALSIERACFIVVKAREFDAKEEVVEDDPASNPSDEQDPAVEVLEDYGDDPTEDELSAAIAALDEEARAELIALVWLGRGDYTAEEWQDAKAQAADRAAEHGHTSEYLTGIPLLGDYLEEGLNAMGFSCRDVEIQHL